MASWGHSADEQVSKDGLNSGWDGDPMSAICGTMTPEGSVWLVLPLQSFSSFQAHLSRTTEPLA